MELPRRAEDKQVAGKRIGVQFLPAQLRDSIDSLAATDGFNRNQDADLCCDLDHEASLLTGRDQAIKGEEIAIT